MKTVEDLKRLREKLQSETSIRRTAGTQIIVGMGTCGIAAGAREVLTAILDEVAKRKLQDIHVTQTGCIGMCEKEVLVDIVKAGGARISYGRVTPKIVPELIEEHVINDRIVEEWVVGRVTTK